MSADVYRSFRIAIGGVRRYSRDASFKTWIFIFGKSENDSNTSEHSGGFERGGAIGRSPPPPFEISALLISIKRSGKERFICTIG